MSAKEKGKETLAAGPSLTNGLELIRIHPEGNSRDVFGFQLSGNRTMGVYIRAILGGTDVDKCGRLQVGDQLIQVDDMHLAGMTTDQVARVLRLSLELHGSTELTVAHKSARSKGHAWRPLSPLSTSFSDSNLAQEVASKTRRDSKNIHKAEIHGSSEGKQKSDVIPKSSTHDALMMISELEEDDAISPAGDTEYSVLPEDYAPLPNIPPVTEEGEQRGQSRRTGKITPLSASSVSQKKRAKASSPIGSLRTFSPKVNHHKQEDDLPAPDEKEIKQNYSGGDFKDDFLETAQRKLSSPTLGTENLKDFLSSAQRKSFMRREKKSTEEVPLVCFDQLNRSYTDICGTDNPLIKRTNSESSKSSSSNRSNKSSNGSQHLAWQCPVCFDGANRINKTKRRLMSTACGHVFCSRCVADIVRQHKVCPTCRKAVKTGQVHPIFM